MKELRFYLEEKTGVTFTDSELREIKKLASAKPQKFNFTQALLNYGFEEELVAEWTTIRKAKKGVNTEFAFKNFIKQIELNGSDKNQLLEAICKKQWVGYNHQWETGETNRNLNTRQNGKADGITNDFKRAILRDLQTGGNL